MRYRDSGAMLRPDDGVQGFLSWLGELPKGWTVAGSTGVTLALAWLNALVGWEVSFSVLYVLPIAAVSWTAGRRAGVALSLLAATGWFVANEVSGFPASQAWIPYWNALVRFAFFVIVALLVATLRRTVREARSLARTDPVTHAANARAFHEAAARELLLTRRTGRAFALVYLDLDNFKRVNDRLGHAAGDQLLALVARCLMSSVRSTDVVARIGGDEFALLLPETDVEGADAVLTKAQRELRVAVDKAGWPVTFSAGAIVCPGFVPTIEPVLAAADQLMYEVKHAGKDASRVRVLGRDTPPGVVAIGPGARRAEFGES